MKNTCWISLLLFFTILFNQNSSGQINRRINIPGRLQWDNSNGYCGETSIQMIGLYYGNYISQNISRSIAGGSQVLIGNNNGEKTIDKLAFTFEVWDFNKTTPQYQEYLVWLKKQLNNSHPVIITAYIKGMSDPDYDHILPAIGFTSSDTTTFHDTDQLIYNDCYDSSSYSRTFQSIWDLRSMIGNGANNKYCIPKNINFGCAVTGIKDDQHVTKPIHLTLDKWNEPNVSIGESAIMMKSKINIDSLNIGTKYALLRYNNYTSVPSSGFNPSNASSVVYFTATASSQVFTDSFMSNTAVFFRCIPYNYTSNSQVNISATVSTQPNCLVPTGTITASSTTTGVTFSIDGSIYINTTGIFSGVRPGTYSVTAKNSSNDISAAVSVMVMQQPASPAVPIITSGSSTTFCPGNSVTLNSNTSSGNQWYKNAILISGAAGNSFIAYEAGTYTDSISNTNGCKTGSLPSIVIVKSTPTKPTINWNGNTFSTNSSATSFQWSVNNVSLFGATQATYKPLTIGFYKVQITNSDACSNISDSFNLVVTAIKNSPTTSNTNYARIFPNPASPFLQIKLNESPNTTLDIQLISSDGRIVQMEKTKNKITSIPISNLPSGNYFIKIIGKNYYQSESFIISK